jgi:deoxyribonuclease (pyrimidine dimer)
MTRINAGIPPKMLSNAHLLAEHREIKRIPNNIVKRLKEHKQINLGPAHFTLGEGHVNFFNDKLEYLHSRYISLYKECLLRKFEVENYEEAFLSAREWACHLYNSWRPRKIDIQTILLRLVERDELQYKQCSAYKIWKEELSKAVEQLKESDPDLYNHIKLIKK